VEQFLAQEMNHYQMVVILDLDHCHLEAEEPIEQLQQELTKKKTKDGIEKCRRLIYVPKKQW
jgi:23S rRNA U2552 (ribose-2'-O)-methylase RlmE/FtsJ